jgi:hypothetical protein
LNQGSDSIQGRPHPASHNMMLGLATVRSSSAFEERGVISADGPRAIRRRVRTKGWPSRSLSSSDAG